MSAPRPALLIGLTGGIASGKSTVAQVFHDRGAFVVDLDRVAHETMEPGGAAYADVVERFGPAILAPDGRIDRKRLGPIVFADPSALADLNGLVHPHVRSEWRRRVDEFSSEAPPPRIAVIEAALLVETGQHRDLDGLVVVHCSPETQLRRLMERDGLSESAARERIDSQAPVSEKLAAANWLIETDGTMEASLEQAHATFDRLEKLA